MALKPIGGKIWKRGVSRGAPDEMGREVKNIIEALLFVADEPLSVKRLQDVTGFDREKILEALEELKEELREENRGIQLREVGEGWRLHSHPAHAEYIERLILSERKTRLTRAAIETLAIIAYLQPITRTQIASIRGVQSETIVKYLEERGLVREVGREKAPGGPALYGTTEKFLERFGLTSLEELPPLENFQPDAQTIEQIKISLSSEPKPVESETTEGNQPE